MSRQAGFGAGGGAEATLGSFLGQRGDRYFLRPQGRTWPRQEGTEFPAVGAGVPGGHSRAETPHPRPLGLALLRRALWSGLDSQARSHNPSEPRPLRTARL